MTETKDKKVIFARISAQNAPLIFLALPGSEVTPV